MAGKRGAKAMDFGPDCIQDTSTEKFAVGCAKRPLKATPLPGCSEIPGRTCGVKITFTNLYSMGSAPLRMPALPHSPVSRAHFHPILDETRTESVQKISICSNLLAPDAEEAMNEHFTGVPASHDYAPYGNKTMCYLDILDNLPRLRLSSSQFKMILWMMKECGAKDVPSFNAFRSMQKHIRKTWDFSNPEVAPHIQKYPEDVDGGPISEIWQRYYIHEVAELSDARWVIPALWIICRGKVYADCHLGVGVQSVQPEIVRISLDLFKFNHEDLVRHLGAPVSFSESSKEYGAKIPNQLRAIDNGEDLFTVWVPVWADDVSGARSKQYQKHINVIPRTPPAWPAPATGIFCAKRADHAAFGWASQMHQQTTLNKLRKLLTSGIKAVISVAVARLGARVKKKSVQMVTTQSMRRASHGMCKRSATVCSPNRPRHIWVAARVEALQTASGTKDKIAQHWIDILIQKAHQPYNPLLDLPHFDPSQDTLVEILHTILLGDAKYTWYELHHNWTPAQQNIFTVRLQSTNLDGLRVPPIRAAYMMQYRNGLIGKHFNTHADDDIPCPRSSFTGPIRACACSGRARAHSLDAGDRQHGELSGIYMDSIQLAYTKKSQADLQIIDNLLDAFATLDPTKILIKLKLHVLLHIIDDIRSRARRPLFHRTAKLADLDRVKHILSGGYWLEDEAWIRAGKDVHRILRDTPIIQRHLGWAPPPVWTPEEATKEAALSPEQTLIVGAANLLGVTIDPGHRTNGQSVTARSGDSCKADSWAIFRLNN
ncbi:hypothetical protein FB451DRAFT_1191987, partial [Mycena latifolia]